MSVVCSPRVLQFQAVGGGHSDTDRDRGGEDGDAPGLAPPRRPVAALPVYMTQDRLTLAVLTLLLGGWLAFALTYPVVSCDSRKQTQAVKKNGNMSIEKEAKSRFE